jgi:hypothetical protein
MLAVDMSMSNHSGEPLLAQGDSYDHEIEEFQDESENMNIVS